jgi:hypothetical protein
MARVYKALSSSDRRTSAVVSAALTGAAESAVASVVPRLSLGLLPSVLEEISEPVDTAVVVAPVGNTFRRCSEAGP